MAIDGEAFEAAITNTLKGSEPKAAVEVNENIEEAWKELSTEEQAAFRRSAEVWWPPEDPARRDGEARATHAIRCEQAEADRQTMLDRDQVKAFRKAQQPHKLQNVVTGMAQGLREEAAALRRDAAAKAEEQEQLQKAQRERSRRESGGLGGSCRQI